MKPPLKVPERIGSIAVLPFENLSGDPAQEYFADGMTEELTTNLGKISALRVISRTSVMQYKGSRKPLPEIARELNVDAIVEGAAKRSGNHVHVTANLLYAPGDQHLWACTYESELGDVLILQSTMARSIADEIGIRLLSDEKSRLARAHSVDPDAYQAYLRGKYYASKWNEDGLKKGAASFRQAIDLDPTYAQPYAGLAEVHVLMGAFGLRPSRVFPLAEAEALKALELDDGLAEAHADLGMVKLEFDWDWAGAEQEFKRAITLNTNSSEAHFFYSVFLTALDRPDEAIKEAQTALRVDPLSLTMSLDLGWVLYFARRHDESIAQLKKTLDLAPEFGYPNMELGWNYAQKGMYTEAVAQCQRAVALLPTNQVALGSCGGVYGTVGRRQDALALLDRVKRLSKKGYVDPWNVAWLYDGLGDNDSTMIWLERAYRERSASLYHVKNYTWSGRLRADPRFQGLLNRMEFPT
jgi:TolB-like protein/Tfp pilus assembly protein PilF